MMEPVKIRFYVDPETSEPHIRQVRRFRRFFLYIGGETSYALLTETGVSRNLLVNQEGRSARNA